MSAPADDRPLARTDASIEQDLLEFLVRRTGRAWEPDLDLFDRAGLTSLFALELVVHTEQTFGIEIGGDDLALDNFRTVRRIAALVGRLRGRTDG